jgi:three-Cys-motif partner protein
MRSPEFYKGREQTYLKHFFLEKYLQSVAFHIGYSHPRFVYVDGFSGPWRAQGDDLSDTSFRIALDQLNYVQTGLAAPPHHKHPSIEAIFIEKDPSAYAALAKAANDYKGAIKAIPLPGTFEANIPKIIELVGKAFAFFFIDPTGWKGIEMQPIRPLLTHARGEVIINFMYDHINRFLNSNDPKIEAQLDALFGTDKWKVLRDVTEDREYAIIEFYRDQIRLVGGFPFVTSTRILKPTQDRAYYHLVYATRNHKGILEFRAVEKASVPEQEQVRLTAKRQEREDRTRQAELALGPISTEGEFAKDRAKQAQRAEERVVKTLQGHVIDYSDLAPHVLELPLVWESDLKALLLRMRDAGKIRIDGLGPRDRTPKAGCRISLI